MNKLDHLRQEVVSDNKLSRAYRFDDQPVERALEFPPGLRVPEGNLQKLIKPV